MGSLVTASKTSTDCPSPASQRDLTAKATSRSGPEATRLSPVKAMDECEGS